MKLVRGSLPTTTRPKAHEFLYRSRPLFAKGLVKSSALTPRHLFSGDVVNVSAWKDSDKEGRYYRDYFSSASSYMITNYKPEMRGHQGSEGEIFLDLTQDLPANLALRFDVAFNHTTLEHIFDIQTAFTNLCSMSRDIVILVLPFMQQYHSDYGDFWRLSPLAIKRLFEMNKFELVYQSFNNNQMSSVYTFSIASRHPDRWRSAFDWKFTCSDLGSTAAEPYIGSRMIPNLGYKIGLAIQRISIARWKRLFVDENR